MSIFPALLTLHLIGLIIMAGATLIDFINYQTFWKLFHHQKEQATGVLVSGARFSRLIGIGGALLIITGAGMIALTHGSLANQLWFKIKMVFVLLLIVNGAFNGKRLTTKLRNGLIAKVPFWDEQALGLKGKLWLYFGFQLSVFLIIIFLSTYKFN
jgi:uncharacterized membrane protein SirB2